MATVSVTLTPELEQLVRDKIASGRYQSVSEVFQDALRLLEEEDRMRQTKLEALRDEIQKGLKSGRVAPWDAEAFKRSARERRQNSKD